MIPYHQAVEEFRRAYLRHALAAHGGNRAATARTLGLQRTYLLRLLRDRELTGIPSATPQGRAEQRRRAS